MRIYSCICGMTKHYGNLPPEACMACLNCFTHPTTDRVNRTYPSPHQYAMYPGGERCKMCFRSRLELEPPEDD